MGLSANTTYLHHGSVQDVARALIAFCSNLFSVTTLISHTPLEARGGETLYFRWRGESRQR